MEEVEYLLDIPRGRAYVDRGANEWPRIFGKVNSNGVVTEAEPLGDVLGDIERAVREDGPGVRAAFQERLSEHHARALEPRDVSRVLKLCMGADLPPHDLRCVVFCARPDQACTWREGLEDEPLFRMACGRDGFCRASVGAGVMSKTRVLGTKPVVYRNLGLCLALGGGGGYYRGR